MQSAPDAVETSELVATLRTLPTRAGIAAQLLVLLENPEVTPHQVAQIIQTDPSLAARVLRLANSPYFGLNGSVASCTQAIVVLGFSVIRSLSVTSAVGLFGESGRGMPAGFWDHAARVAAGASLVAKHRGLPPGDAFSAGLLHDLGRALLFRHDPAVHMELEHEFGADSLALCAAEREHFGMDHCEAAAIVLEQWRLPHALVEAVRVHHRPFDEVDGRIARFVMVGEALADLEANEAHGPAIEPNEVLAALPAPLVERIRRDMRGEMERITSLFTIG
ncbi:MAG: HDOD domain-containing protein [Acidimicrobiia bacterium]